MDFRVPENSTEKKVTYRLIHRTFPYTSATIFAFLVMIFCLIVAAIFQKYLSSDVLPIAILLVGVDVFLSTLSLNIWSLGKSTRSGLRAFWEKSTPPHEPSSNLNTFSNYLMYVLGTLRATYSNRCDKRIRDPKKPFFVGSIQLILGSVVALTAIFLLEGIGVSMTSSAGGDEVTISQTVSLFAAFLSVLLGPVIGVITLGMFSAAVYSEDIIFFVFFILFPSVLFVPASKNLITTMDLWLRERMYNKNFGSKSLVLICLTSLLTYSTIFPLLYIILE